jgi:exopolyphosphatase / guanosine-5'-triphosphate,3'-diphosphate pyrophosphatase
MKIAVIDIGSNSIRCEAFETVLSGLPRRILHERSMLRIGNEVFSGGSISEDSLTLLEQVLRGLAEQFAALEMDSVVAVSTSAYREALNRVAFVERIRQSLGIEVRILSPEEEAKYIAKGILEYGVRDSSSALASFDFSAPLVLADIGGGSTELTEVIGGQVVRSVSIPVGSLRMRDLYLPLGPPLTAVAESEIRMQTRTLLKRAIKERPPLKPETMIGSSGTVRSLARLRVATEGIEDLLTVQKLQTLISEMRGLSIPELCEIPGMEESRADIVPVGALLLDEVAAWFGIKNIIPTQYSLRHGIFQEELERRASEGSA